MFNSRNERETSLIICPQPLLLQLKAIHHARSKVFVSGFPDPSLLCNGLRFFMASTSRYNDFTPGQGESPPFLTLQAYIVVGVEVMDGDSEHCENSPGPSRELTAQPAQGDTVCVVLQVHCAKGGLSQRLASPCCTRLERTANTPF